MKHIILYNNNNNISDKLMLKQRKKEIVNLRRMLRKLKKPVLVIKPIN